MHQALDENFVVRRKSSTFVPVIESGCVGNEEACQSDGLFLTVKTERATCSTSAKSSIIRSVNLTLEILLYPISYPKRSE